MSKDFVVDASVFAKLLVNEEESLIVESLISKIIASGSYILVPSLFTYELVGIFKKNKLPKKVIIDFVDFYRSFVKPVEINDKIINLALDITEEGHKKSGFPSFYDSTYHAVAILNNCNFITADKKHYNKTAHLGNVIMLNNLKK